MGNMTENAFFVKLKNRALIHIEGEDRIDFIQGLITNDIHKLKAGEILYSCFLTPQGKFLYDFFIHGGEDFLLLDCEGGERAQELYKKLNMYRLRKDVQISIEDSASVYAVFGSDIGYQDPRSKNLGRRSFEKPDLEERGFEEWDKRRINETIPDGSRDLIPEKSTMDEGQMDKIGAIDYDKGCYVGQELTARMHYRGLGKRQLQTVNINDLPDGADLRSQCGDIGIALVKNNK